MLTVPPLTCSYYTLFLSCVPLLSFPPSPFHSYIREMADQQTSQNVRFVSVTLKKNYSPSKVKLKLLRSIRQSEKRERQATSISHPLSPWKERVHTLADLPAGQVKKVYFANYAIRIEFQARGSPHAHRVISL